MRAKLLGVALAALVTPAALAGDITKPSKIAALPVAEAQEAAWNRSGFYVGAVAGYDVTVLQAEGVDFANGKLMGGGFIGWNWRVSPQFMLGLEADWVFTSISAATTVDEVTLKASTDHLVTLRARAGVPLGPALVYVTGGPAWQQVKLAVGEVSGREWQLGMALGGGAEVELTRSLALRLEAIHYIFPNEGAPLADILESSNQHTTVRLGVLFKLN